MNELPDNRFASMSFDGNREAFEHLNRAEPGSTVRGRPLADPIVQTAAYAFADGEAASLAALDDQPLYARDGLPNVRLFEREVARWEGAEDAVAVASGMAALSLVLLSLLNTGDRLLLASDAYPETRDLVRRHLNRFGIAADWVDFANPTDLARAFARRPTLVLVETIANPAMRLHDLPAIIAGAQAAGALVCVDNTFASPALCRPLAFGADLVLQSAGKFLAGHHDVTAGVIAGSTSRITMLRADAQLFGAALAPMEAWLAVRGMQTLAQRMSWVSRSAELLLNALAGHPALAEVYYPGLGPGSDPSLVRALLPHGGGGLLAIRLARGARAAARFTEALRTIPYAATVGGSTTTVSYPPASSGARDRRGPYPGCGTVRVSLGLEDPAVLAAEICHALDRVLVEVDRSEVSIG